MKAKKLLFVFMLIAILFSACDKSGIVSVSVENLPEGGAVLEDFAIDDLMLTVKYSNNIVKNVSLKEDMIEEQSRQKLYKAGTHAIYFSYEGFDSYFIITLFETRLHMELNVIYKLAAESGAVGISYEEWLKTIKGKDGKDGQNIILRVDSGYIQWKYENDVTWSDLLSLDSISQNGLSAYEIYMAHHPEYAKSESEWLSDLMDGILAEKAFYTVTFIIEGEQPLIRTVEKGHTLSDIPDITKPDYVFCGWYTGPGVNDGKFTTLSVVTDNITVYPRWEELASVKITFSVNGGNEVAAVTGVPGHALTLSIPERLQFIFAGWFTDKAMSAEFTGDVFPDTDLTLYAKWRLPNIEEVKELIDDNDEGINVTFRGRVIGFDSMGFAHVADETGAIYVRVERTNPYYHLLTHGNSVEISGIGFIYRGHQYYPEYTRQIQNKGTVIKEVEDDIGIPNIFEPASGMLLQSAFENDVKTVFHGNITRVTGRLQVGADEYSFYLLDEYGYPFIQVHHYSSNFQNTTSDPDINVFLGLNGREITLTGIIYRLYETENIWTIQCIGLSGELIVHDDEFFDLHILTINDLHGAVEQDGNYQNGIANMAYLIEEIRNYDPKDDVILIGNGDMFQGSGISNRTYGQSVLNVMNMMNFDCMGLGNHEFDWGINRIFDFFDGDDENSEASFPLINANIFLVSDGSLLINAGGNMFEYVVIEKEGIKVGIIGYIGDVYASISYERVRDYYFDLNISNSVKTIGSYLKQNGVDIIVVNIHGGSAEGLMQYPLNNELMNLKDEGGSYLVDVIINGHTHSTQSMVYERADGSYVSLIQAGSNGRLFGQITLTVDNDGRVAMIQNNYVYTSSAGYNYIYAIQSYIDEVKASLGNEVLAVAGETVNRPADLEAWTGNVMLAATGADIAVANTGGIRSTGGIKAGWDITVNQMYMVYPFDNNLWIMDMDYYQVQSFLRNTALYHKKRDGIVFSPGFTYKVCVISYVYFWDQLDGIRNENNIETDIYIRDILIDDLIAKGNAGHTFKPITDPSASIGILLGIPAAGPEFIEEAGSEYRSYAFMP